LIPKHTVYIEPFFGSGAFLFNQDPTDKIEVVNDLDEELTHFWRILRDQHSFPKLQIRLEATPYSEIEFLEALNSPTSDPIERAARFFILVRQSLSARRKSFAPIVQTRLRRHMCDNVSAWLSAIEGLPAVHERLRTVSILQMDALDVLERFNRSNAFVLADPPWLHSTRTSTREYGPYEMSVEAHVRLLDVLQNMDSKVMLLGYESDLYNITLKEWNKFTVEMANHSGIGKKKQKRYPTVWMNY